MCTASHELQQLRDNAPCVHCHAPDHGASFNATGCAIVVYSVLLSNSLTNPKIHPTIADPGTCYVLFTNLALRKTYDWHVIPTALHTAVGVRRSVKLFKMLGPASALSRHRGPMLYVANKIRLMQPPIPTTFMPLCHWQILTNRGV